MKIGKIFAGIIVVLIIFCLAMSTQLLETVQSGTYHVIQRPVTGAMEAKNQPGMYFQALSQVMVWNNMETFYFTSDTEEGAERDQSMEVRFNDGSVANISGTMRVQLPTSDIDQIGLVTNFAFRNYVALEAKFIMPIVRNALRRTANLMTARESYSEKRTRFNDLAWDQIQNGLYIIEEVETTTNEIVGKNEDGSPTYQKVTRLVNVIQKGEDGLPLREANPLEGTGITLANFEVKQFVYKGKVNEQIAIQQENLMAIATAKAERQRAEEEERKVVAQGKKNVATAKYQKEEEKIRAVVDAEKNKEVAELDALRELEVAKLAKLAAAEEKQKQILLGEGESRRKQLVMQADGALKQKLDTILEINKTWASAYSTRKVPATYIAGSGAGGNGNPDDQFSLFMNMMNVKAANDLSLNMKTK